MNYKILIYASLLSCVAILASACKDKVDTQKNIRINSDKPTVYVEFVKLAKRVDTKPFTKRSSEEPPAPPEEFEAALLRVYNNSRWAIQFQMRYDSPAPSVETKPLLDKGYVFVPLVNAELELVYGVESVNSEAPIKFDLKRKIPYIRLYSSITDVWLLPGQSVVFVVKRDELRENLQVFLPFKYDWEISGQNKGYEEPQHRAHFTWWEFEKAAGL